MADYTIMSEVGNALVRILREAMVPEVIQNDDAIGLCSPDEKGDFVLGLYLYDIRESEEVFETGMRMSDNNTQKYPSKYMELYYMVTAYSMSDIKFRAEEEQRILGRTIQAFMDHVVLDGDLFGEAKENTRYRVRIEQLRLDNDEKMKLWVFPNVPYKLSLYYKVSPIEIESTKVREVHRVTQMDMEVVEKQRKL